VSADAAAEQEIEGGGINDSDRTAEQCVRLDCEDKVSLAATAQNAGSSKAKHAGFIDTNCSVTG